ncbi:hypothetical protein ANANG_G00251790 [Anguilla anguilla]|uniref:Uncharacterized protein n=1 Tax=Anguilla anguilla TaxID=7936 RepID=A0A9D3LSE1_ANGAN|nr:hypothetical protein ANANG_G00251790 [Anguilla anguilla]
MILWYLPLERCDWSDISGDPSIALEPLAVTAAQRDCETAIPVVFTFARGGGGNGDGAMQEVDRGKGAAGGNDRWLIPPPRLASVHACFLRIPVPLAKKAQIGQNNMTLHLAIYHQEGKQILVTHFKYSGWLMIGGSGYGWSTNKKSVELWIYSSLLWSLVRDCSKEKWSLSLDSGFCSVYNGSGEPE